jgi:hypothetical protein
LFAMATRTYGPQTLNDNWFEDHAKPLNGVVADYGNREYGTTFKDDFKRSDLVDTRSGWQARQGARRTKYGLGMVTTDNVQRYKDVITRENPSDFRALLPQPMKNETTFYDETTTAAGFGRGKKETLAERKRRTGRLARSAGNQAKPEKGMQGSGAIGERLNVASDPQNDTAAQRSWLYSEDVMFSAPKERKEETRVYATLNVKGDGADARPAPRTNDTVPSGFNVFNNRLIPSI